MLDRRGFLLTSAAIAACAPQRVAADDAGGDAAFRALVDRLNDAAPRERRRELAAFNPSSLGPQGRILYDAVKPGVEAEAEAAGAGNRPGAPYAVTTRTGAYRRVTTALAAPNADISTLAREIDADTAQVAADEERGFIAPAYILDRTISAIASTRASIASNGAARPVDDALARQVTLLQAQRARTSAGDGVWRARDGDAFYQQSLAVSLGENVDPREAHARALSVVRDLQSEADAILRVQGLTRGSVAERLRAMLRDERYLYSDDHASRNLAVAEMNAWLRRIRTLLPNAFNGLENTPAEVRRMAPEEEARAAAGRREGAAYIVDLARIRTRPKWTLPSVVAHELLPGHLLQAPLGEAARAPRLQARYASGYSEGWAIYAERLADELGLYQGDIAPEHYQFFPLYRLGYLHWMLFRYARVVADTGVHVMRWSRERAISEMQEMQGASIAFISIEEDVERFIVQPGSYAAQGIAALSIYDLRERARGRGGYDIKRFHDAMLRHGPLSPPGLRQAANVAFG